MMMMTSSPEMTEKKPYFSFFFKRLQKKTRKGVWKRFRSSGFRWKTKFHWFVDGFLFKIVSALEAVGIGFIVANLLFRRRTTSAVIGDGEPKHHRTVVVVI
ncbi:hypothetical protein Ccrd_008725 [Cynara cardunculus var. scolymus]|uniref:Uncharacterized protein n=1 Tax=Cynara cardunculus var. scolymus TaxID=59895 RepID=A0A118JSJ6_CYNCS|nr:hypothetical protein Ccrd_008725 [Cynara cardunculus var. scolymus]